MVLMCYADHPLTLYFQIQIGLGAQSKCGRKFAMKKRYYDNLEPKNKYEKIKIKIKERKKTFKRLKFIISK